MKAMAPSDLTDLRLPPQNLDAEQSVLGAILLDNASLSKAFELITEEDFYRKVGHHLKLHNLP